MKYKYITDNIRAYLKWMQDEIDAVHEKRWRHDDSNEALSTISRIITRIYDLMDNHAPVRKAYLFRYEYEDHNEIVAVISGTGLDDIIKSIEHPDSKILKYELLGSCNNFRNMGLIEFEPQLGYVLLHYEKKNGQSA